MINKLDELGLKEIKKINHNLSYDELFELEKANNEGRVSSNGTFMVDTGIFTGRSPKDKYFVKPKIHRLGQDKSAYHKRAF